MTISVNQMLCSVMASSRRLMALPSSLNTPSSQPNYIDSGNTKTAIRIKNTMAHMFTFNTFIMNIVARNVESGSNYSQDPIDRHICSTVLKL